MFAMEYKTIGAKILYYRRIKGWTQEYLAEIAGISRARLSDIECGKGPYNIESLLLIGKALGVDVADLLKNDKWNRMVFYAENVCWLLGYKKVY